MTNKPRNPNDVTSDLLFEVRTNYWLGHYQAAINAALTLQSKIHSKEVALERDVYVYRSYLEQTNYNIILEEINETSSPKPLQVIRLLALYLSNDKRSTGVEANQTLVDNLEQILTTDSSLKEENLWTHYLAAALYYRMSVYDRTLRQLAVVLQKEESFLEARVLMIELYLRLHRIDLAEKELKALQSMHDYAIPTLLAACWVYLAKGGDKVQDALYICQELIEKYSASVPLLLCLAVAQMHLKNFADAEKTLLEALEKNSKCAEVLANLIVCYYHLKKAPELVARVLSQLKVVAPTHLCFLQTAQLEDAFDRATTRYSV
jgi:coatomer protein complex subunit epsilon